MASLLELDPDAALPDLARTGGFPRILDLPRAPEFAGPGETLPDRIGPYRILGVLGRGGMGIVYRAEQTEPLRREVAIKLVRGGLDRALVLERFRTEQRTLAIMEHAGIARVLDAGVDEEDRPYFVMDLVRGAPITEFCRADSLPLEARLRLFRDVCDAVQHAHQKGIIHRDLKPSNILITIQSGVPESKVIDFGIAKALGGELPGSTLTREGQFVGTLEYMSPEQAGGRPEDVDTRTDVYALGVVLYELVTGRLPYDVSGKTLVEAARLIAEQPPCPISRPDSGGMRFNSDLVTVVFKALEKEPDRRYGSAAALAEDIERYLDGQPVLAHPPGTIYQVRKLVARNKLPAALVATLTLSLAIFGATMSLLYQAQRTERARADAEAAKAQEANTFLRQMLSSVNSQGRSVTVREVLDVASRDIDASFGAQPEVKAAIHSTLGSAFAALNELDDAGRHIREAFEIRRGLFGDRSPQVATSLSELAGYEVAKGWDVERGHRADSLAQLAFTIRRETLGNDDPDITASLVQLAGLDVQAGRNEMADSLYRESIDRTRRRLGNEHPDLARLLEARGLALFAMRREIEAETTVREALATFRRAYRGDHADKSRCVGDLAFVAADPAEQESLAVEHVAMERRMWGDDHPNLIPALSQLGQVYLNHLRFDDAEVLGREALVIAEKHFASDDVAIGEALNDLATEVQGKGEYEEAASLYDRALRIFEEKLGEDHVFATICRSNLTSALDQLGRDNEALRLLEGGLVIAEETRGRQSGDAALNHRWMAEFLNRRGRSREAEMHAKAAVAVFRGDGHRTPNWAYSICLLAISLHGEGRHADAAAMHAEADSVWRENGKVPPQAIGNLLEWGICLRETGRLDEADLRLKEARARFVEEFGEGHQDYPTYVLALAELDADRGDWGPALERAAAARGMISAQIESESKAHGGDWYQRRERRTNLARADAVLARGRSKGHALQTD